MGKAELHSYSLNRIFDEIEFYDDWLRKHQSSEEEKNFGLQWRIIESKEVDKRIKKEIRNSKIDQHIKELVNLLNKIIKGKSTKCKHCLQEIPLENLLSKPSRTNCSRCALKKLYVQYPSLKPNNK